MDIAKSIRRLAIALRKIITYNSRKVEFKYSDNAEKKEKTEIVYVMEFIARIIRYIPDRSFKTIGYYGLYSKKRVFYSLLDLDKTQISFKNSTFNLRTVMKDDSTKIESQSLLFYIYCEEIVDEETGKKAPLNIAGVKKLFQEKIKTYHPNSRKG
jgi:hypothetical protein